MPEPLRVESLRTLDAAVAEHVMGGEREPPRYSLFDRSGKPLKAVRVGARSRPRNYSTVLAEAWRVVERMRAEGEDPQVMRLANLLLTNYHEGVYGPWWCLMVLRRPFMSRPERIVEVRAPTAPLAISLAALRAVGVEVELSLPEAEERRKDTERSGDGE